MLSAGDAAFINNHYAGHAPAIARAFLAELSKRANEVGTIR
jgi:hypothetical protein